MRTGPTSPTAPGGLRCVRFYPGDDLPDIFRREELGDGDGAGDGADEAVRLLVIVKQGAEELLHLGRRRLE